MIPVFLIFHFFGFYQISALIRAEGSHWPRTKFQVSSSDALSTNRMFETSAGLSGLCRLHACGWAHCAVSPLTVCLAQDVTQQQRPRSHPNEETACPVWSGPNRYQLRPVKGSDETGHAYATSGRRYFCRYVVTTIADNTMAAENRFMRARCG